MALSLVSSLTATTLPAPKGSLISKRGLSSSSESIATSRIGITRAKPGTTVRCSVGPVTDNNGSSSPVNVAEYQKSFFAWPWEHKPHNSYPENFAFGAASSAFQVEGGTKDGGRKPSIWDTFCEKYPEKIKGGRGGEPGAGSYYRYKDDVELLAEIGLNSYRFSISWPRIFPNGDDVPNEEGIAYYNRLIDELTNKGIEPYVTLFHWDVPQALEDKYGGFLSRKIVEDYKKYAKLCFERFGDRVKHWITMNEPQVFIQDGYGFGIHAPGHCTPDLQVGTTSYICPAGDSLREPYMVGHNILLAHSETVKLYKDHYQASQKGDIGITLVTLWYEPYDASPLNKDAQKRALDFNLGWFMDPLIFGDYPQSMRALVGERLPIFTEEQSNVLKNYSTDFLGLNYYTARYVRDRPFDPNSKPKIFIDDRCYDTLVERDGIPIGPSQANTWLNVYPKGLKKLLLYIKERYNNIPVYITENGVYRYNTENEIDLRAPMEDVYRIEYHIAHLHEIEDALSTGADVRGYFAWSLLDSFEWGDGYTCRFGLNHIDYSNLHRPDLTRRPKESAIWLKRYLENNVNSHKKISEPGVYLVPSAKGAQSNVVKVST